MPDVRSIKEAMIVQRISSVIRPAKWVGLCILFLPLCAANSQDAFFEGRITYLTREFDEQGKQVASPITREEMYLKGTICVIKPVAGQFLDIFDQVDTYLDAQKKLRYGINHTQHFIRNIGPSPEVYEYQLLENRREGEVQVNGLACDLYIIKYARDYDAILNLATDTLRCYYYVSKEWKMPHGREFALLNGNKNSLLLDGRFEGIVVKLLIERKNKSRLEVTATKIEKMDAEEFIRLPDYPVR
jgi:hypothetical protein